MNQPLPIKIRICERTYPLKINPEDEPLVRIVAKKLNESVTKLMNQFSISDRQDLLAIAAFNYLIELEKIHNSQQPAQQKIDLLIQSLSKVF